MKHDRKCDICGGPLEVDRSAERLAWEAHTREEFVTRRLGHRPEELEAMDLTRFMHGEPARLLVCRHCGLLVREEPGRAEYESDLYDPVLMNHLYPRYLRAFEEKKRSYKKLLRPGAEVVELGSHLGAFLEAAENWGWRPVGLDIGASTSAFARKRGGLVRRATLEAYSPHLRKPEAVFIWNCFEQLEDPNQTLIRAHELLDRHGLIVLRVPNAGFYRRQRREFDGRRPHRALNSLAYNNLLGFPYLRGYDEQSIKRLLRLNDFEPIQARGASLLTPPYPQMSRRISEEWRQARQGSPWIEVVGRRKTG